MDSWAETELLRNCYRYLEESTSLSAVVLCSDGGGEEKEENCEWGCNFNFYLKAESASSGACCIETWRFVLFLPQTIH